MSWDNPLAPMTDDEILEAISYEHPIVIEFVRKHLAALYKTEGKLVDVDVEAIMAEAKAQPLTRQQARHLIDTYCGDEVPDEGAAIKRLTTSATVGDLSQLLDGERGDDDGGAQLKIDGIIYGDLK